ncbi:MAG: phosphotransferase enzyme family protein [Candidatus Sericytochromatia bacterium]
MLTAELLDRIQPEELEQAASLWLGQIQAKVGETENLLYRCQGEPDFALRLVHQSHRNLLQLQAEMAWLETLSQAGLSVCQPLLSELDSLFVSREIGGEIFWISAFAWIAGEPVSRENRQSWSPALLRSLGALAAQMHLRAHILPESLYLARPDWVPSFFLHRQSELDAAWFWRAVEKTQFALSLLPIEPACFGLIHGDIHSGNFLLQADQVWLFDFDDCHRGWFNQDLALILYYILGTRRDQELVFRAHITHHLREGYSAVMPWPETFESECPLFFRWRDLQLYAFLHTRWRSVAEMPERAQQAQADLAERIQNQ